MKNLGFLLIALGTLTAPTPGGPATISLPVALEPGDTVIVTVEPEAGSTEPTMEPLVSAEVR